MIRTTYCRQMNGALPISHACYWRRTAKNHPFRHESGTAIATTSRTWRPLPGVHWGALQRLTLPIAMLFEAVAAGRGCAGRASACKAITGNRRADGQHLLWRYRRG
jgi:hypothetical protein